MTLVWPRKLLPPQMPRPHYLSHMNISGPVSQTGVSDVISGDAGFWRATYGSVIVTTRDRVITWRAIAAKLQGRLNPILVPYCSSYQPIVQGLSIEPVPHDDGSFFDDGTGYIGSKTQVLLTADLSFRAVFCTVDVVVADTIQPGQVFSLGERLYQVTDVIDLGGTIKQISFMPPAREAVAADSELEFTNPVCRMRLATDDAMAIDLDLNKRGLPSVDFIEDLAP
ncbi:hypothetical protein [Rhizobium leguminosarum]|uniref:hypothetical protein n=1 Tax=Rhizobium leguminosarum TaxID=384 RepID=UPI00144292A8|nr:hypothetical protein [Rhizobium leguminosarum]MBY5863267.1 hypothetical protein [Rhizobium leguminosarum]NKM04147.1 hypothetical protein [Rhizobium leguminosarum bv. viciae]